jgi:DNA replication and repair protein RecF
MYIKHLKLENFRKFKQFEIEFNKDTNIIIGNNAHGKSTILEAICLITDGYSPWTSDISDIIYSDKLMEHEIAEPYFRIETILCDDSHEGSEIKQTVLSYYHSPEKKKFLINGKATTKNKFFAFTSTNIFSPEQIELLMISPGKRRTFIDRIITRIDPEYHELIVKYERILRQRNAYLKRLSKNYFDTGELNFTDSQLAFWTKEIALKNAEIMQAREKYIEVIGKSAAGVRMKYLPSISANGFISMIAGKDLAAQIENQLNEKLKRDVIVGYTNMGIHRDDWALKTDKDIHRFGSRGEKRLALINVIFSIQGLQKEYLEYFPILLLDDLSSELDDINVTKILTSDYLSKQQVFLTSIRDDENIEKFRDDKSNLINLNE